MRRLVWLLAGIVACAGEARQVEPGGNGGKRATNGGTAGAAGKGVAGRTSGAGGAGLAGNASCPPDSGVTGVTGFDGPCAVRAGIGCAKGHVDCPCGAPMPAVFECVDGMWQFSGELTGDCNCSNGGGAPGSGGFAGQPAGQSGGVGEAGAGGYAGESAGQSGEAGQAGAGGHSG